MILKGKSEIKNIGFISTRIAGTDGVSLEIEKWAAVLERNDYRCFYFSGENDRSPDKCMLVEEAHFFHDDILYITDKCFGHYHRPDDVTRRIHTLRVHLKQKIYAFIRKFDIHLLIPENILAIPVNIPLGMALVEVMAETCIPTLAHHHDFSWERDRFLVNAVRDYLDFAFPPDLHNIEHAVINSIASEQLSHRKGISNTIIPNVYDFASPPQKPKNCSEELRLNAGLGEDDLFILQPTRVVPRKWIERSLEIVSLMKLRNPVLVISHSAEDEGDLYSKRIEEYAHNLGVKITSIEQFVGQGGAYGENNNKPFSIGDVYRCADLVTYPSGYEGFGNAFLEAVYYRIPTVVNRYSIYIVDIEPKGFDVIAIEGFVSSDTIGKIEAVLSDNDRKERMVETNYRLGVEYFSFEVLERLLLNLISTLKRKCIG